MSTRRAKKSLKHHSDHVAVVTIQTVQNKNVISNE